MRERHLFAWTILLVACTHHGGSSSSSSSSPDAAVAVCSVPQLPSYCVSGGLAGLPFDATTQWTLTGTFINYGSAIKMPYTATTTIVRDGDGCGHLSIFGHGLAGVTVDDTSASMDKHTPHPGGFFYDSFTLCVDASGALRYSERNEDYTEAGNWQYIDGTLTHS
jgi:hypothetical protein